MSKPTIRLAESSDDASIAKLSIIGWQKAYVDVFPADFLAGLQWQERAVGRQTFFADPQKFSLVTEIDQRIVGFCDFGPARLVTAVPEINTNFAELYACYVSPDHMGTGIGKNLVNTMSKYLVDKRFKQVIVWTLVVNNQAISFYQKLGFERTTWRKYTKVGADEYLELALVKG